MVKTVGVAVRITIGVTVVAVAAIMTVTTVVIEVIDGVTVEGIAHALALIIERC